MDARQDGEFRLLSNEEFYELSTSEKAEYLRKAIAARNAINQQIDAAITASLIKKDA